MPPLAWTFRQRRRRLAANGRTHEPLASGWSDWRTRVWRRVLSQIVAQGRHSQVVRQRHPLPLDQQQLLKCAFDPGGLMNPGKMFPQLCNCAELGRVHVRNGQTRFPDLPRF